MTEALIGLFGVLVGSGVAYYAQMRATRLAMDGELRRIRAEGILQDHQQRLTIIREGVADILVTTEPSMNPQGVDHRRLLTNVHKLQMLLDTPADQAHRQLNDALNTLALAFTSQGASQLNTYLLQSQMVEAVQAMHRRPSSPPLG